MKKAEIDAVKMVREIRDRHAELLKGMTPEEVIAFYNTPQTPKSAGVKRPRKTERSA